MGPIWNLVALPIWVPTWDPYRLLAGFFKRQISAKPECSRGEVSIFSACVGSRPASTFQKYQEFQAPKKYFTRAYVYMKISEYPLPPTPPEECSCIIIPGAPVSQIKLAW